MGGNTALGGVGNVLTVTGGTIAIGGATRDTTNNNAMNWNGNFSVSGEGQTWNTGTGNVTLNATRNVTVGTVAASTAAVTVGGVISGSGFGVTKAGDGTLTFSNANTYTGNTTVSAGTLTLAGTGSLLFGINGTGVGVSNNSLTNSGATVNLDGGFVLDLTGAGTSVTDIWNILTGVATYGSSFSVSSTIVAFMNTGGNSTLAENGTTYEYAQSTGMLRVIPEPSTYGMLLGGIGLLALFRRRSA